MTIRVRFAVVAAALLGALAYPTVAAADPMSGLGTDRAGGGDCDEAVYDPAGRLADADLAMLRRDARRLARDGATFRLRLYDALPAGGIDAAESADEDACRSWRTDGRRRGDLLVVAVSVTDRQTGIYYGHRWTDRLDDTWRDIQTDDMNPKFTQGRYAEGLHAGLRGIHAELTGTAGHGGDGPPIPVILLIGGVVVLIGGIWVFGIVSIVRGRRRARGPQPWAYPAYGSNIGASSVGDSGSSSSGGDSGGGGSTSW